MAVDLSFSPNSSGAQFLLLVVYEVAAFDGFRGLLAVSSVCVWEVFPVLWNKLFRVAFLKQSLTSL